MSQGVFYLDEDREPDRLSSPSPSSSPANSPRAASPLGSDARSGPISSLAIPPPATASLYASSASTSSTVGSGSGSGSSSSSPVSTTGGLLAPTPQPFGPRKSGIHPFAATPSFPSPLAQAITVPHHSDVDTSSNSSHSSHEDSDRDSDPPLSPGHSASSGTPKRSSELGRLRADSPHSRSISPASTQKSVSRPPSPSRPQALTPSSLLLRNKRSVSGTSLSGSLPTPPAPIKESPKSAPVKRDSPTHPGAVRVQAAGHARARSSSNTSSLGLPSSLGTAGSSPLAAESDVEHEPLSEDLPRRRSSGSSPLKEQPGPIDTKDSNVLGLGWGNWEGASQEGRFFLGARDKGKGKEVFSPSSPSVGRTRSIVSGSTSSPSRPRRQSDFLNPSPLDLRKAGGRPSLGGVTVPSLSTSASMISPLNPLPSPWANLNEMPGALGVTMNQGGDAMPSSSSSGAIRLNRVPTSVRMAAELIKKEPGQGSPLVQGRELSASGSSASTESVPTPNPSPSGIGTPVTVVEPSRALGGATSLPGTLGRSASLAVPDTRGRSSLALPTPFGGSGRGPSPSGVSPLTNPGGPDEVSRMPASSIVALPPNSYKGPAPPTQPRTRPSLPSGVLAEPFTAQPIKHRYRVSMHEAFSKPDLVSGGFADSPRTTASPGSSASGLSPPSSSQLSRSPFGASQGLGLNNLSPATLGAFHPSGAATPGLIQSKLRSVSAKQGLQMDLAGMGGIGDAATHASMIMQSRQAKLQRWRPGSAGRGADGDKMLPPAFTRSTTTGAPAMLAGSRMQRQEEFDSAGLDQAYLTTSPGQDLPPIVPMIKEPASARDIELMPPPPLPSNIGLSRFTSNLEGAGMAPMAMALGMERTTSATGTVAGIDWVDWYDEYKRYKEEKIRAEAHAKASTVSSTSNSPLAEHHAGSFPAASAPQKRGSDPLPPIAGSSEDAFADERLYDEDRDSAVALTPSVSRDELHGVAIGNKKNRRSMSVLSSLSGMDHSRSPIQKRASFLERPRQTSATSTKSTDSLAFSADGKKKKKLVVKMEGWWNAVKSNFVPEQQRVGLGAGRPPAFGKDGHRVPSAPSSRRGSEFSPQGPTTDILSVPLPVLPDDRAEQSHPALRTAASNTSLAAPVDQIESSRQSSAETARMVQSTTEDLGKLSLSQQQAQDAINMPPPPLPPLMNRKPSTVPEEPSSSMPTRPSSSLDARRRTGLRLELESNVLTRASSQMSGSSGSQGSGASAPPMGSRQGSRLGSAFTPASRPSDASSRSNSYGMYGLTPGVPRWDQTPLPLAALGDPTAGLASVREDKPVAPGAEITIASVRRHVIHRLEAAKSVCDVSLRKAIAAMTNYADEQKKMEVLDEPNDYFDGVSESPIVDDGDSEVEAPEGLRLRHLSSSRSHSRRPSISMPLPGGSPTRRPKAIPASPNRIRRRPSAAPRNYAGQRAERISRNASLNLEKTQSASSSRSTSRSHSPMPPATSLLPPSLTTPDLLMAAEAAEADRKFLSALQDLIVIATEVIDTSVQSFLGRPSACTEVIQRIQSVGQNWDEHEDWPGREWFIDILMAVAKLSTVLDWWEAEKGFWNFEDEDEMGKNEEPLVFVMKPSTRESEPSRFDQEFSAALMASPGLSSTADSPGITHLLLPGLQATAPHSSAEQGVLVPDKGTELSKHTSSAISSATGSRPDTPVGQAMDDLRYLAEHAKSVNIVMELSLEGEEILYVNNAILEVTGRDPEDVLDHAVSELCAPADAATFTEATQKLIEDDNNTVQCRFRFEVHQLKDLEQAERGPGPVYIELEGVGMLMREGDEPSHTMWVLRPVAATQVVEDLSGLAAAAFPLEGQISTEGILCRICEREIVTWFFEKHNETCDAVHRLEAEIVDSNECLHELHQTVAQLDGELQSIQAGADRDDSSSVGAVLFYTLPDSLLSGDDDLATGEQGIEVRKITRDQVQSLLDVLHAAQHIQAPSVQDDEADLPFNMQRYLPVESEENLDKVTRWRKPQGPNSDRAFSLLCQHVEDQLRRKQKAVARMQSTIRYSEKTRHEWEDKVNQILAEKEGSGSEASDVSPTSPAASEEGEKDSDKGSGGSAPENVNVSIASIGEAPNDTPPPFGHRRIAAQARLPVTQGHPQRPATMHGSDSTTLSKLRRPATSSGSRTMHIVPTVKATPSQVTIATVHETASPQTMPIRTKTPVDQIGKMPVIDLDEPEPLRPLSRPKPERSKSKQRNDIRPLSPLLAPLEKSHARRVSTSLQLTGGPPLSPRIPSAALQSRAQQPSIKDFEIIKPISRGAFGSVYLAKKVATGDYYAIKALKKSDMIAKNQITNVKAERTILMNQATSPYVVKLFFSFQSKDYLYLVMEYLNGGDCATLVKTLGGLSEDWAKGYVAEVVLGLEYLHARNIVHRDIKPDNLLIDARGHLKLTDFGLSRIGLLNRQVGGPRPAFLRGTSLRSQTRRPPRPGPVHRSSSNSSDSPLLSPEVLAPGAPLSNLSQSYFNSVVDADTADESSGSESASGIIPRHIRAHSTATQQSSNAGTPSVSGRDPPRFVGTPDYLAPESILGIGTDDRAVDWWALGVVLYEFLYGFPPFHADQPEKVFDNVISRRINWHEDEIEISPEARDLMDRLMCFNPKQRLGAKGAEEVKAHAFFAGTDWATITSSEASFIPEVTDPESTDYFDARGAVAGMHDEDAATQVLKQAPILQALAIEEPAKAAAMEGVLRDIAAQDDFGQFNYRNLPVLKQANDEIIRNKLRTESVSVEATVSSSNFKDKERPRSLSVKPIAKLNRRSSDLGKEAQGPPSPSSVSSTASTPSRASIPPSTPAGSQGNMPLLPSHLRRPSELNALERVKSSEDADIIRRSSAPTRVRAGSNSSFSDRSASMELWRQRRQASLNADTASTGSSLAGGGAESPESGPLKSNAPALSPSISFGAGGLSTLAESQDRSLNVLIAEDNPISQKMLETLLTRMGCRCVCVEDGPQALAATMGAIRFDVIMCDIRMPIVNGEQVARMIRSTNNQNQDTPIIACTSYEQHAMVSEEGTLFSAILSKPVTRADLIRCLGKLGFVTTSGGGTSTSGGTVGSVPSVSSMEGRSEA